MDVETLEKLASDTYTSLGLDPARPVRPTKLAAMVLGADPIVRVPRLTGGSRGILFRRGTLRRIALVDGLPPDYALFVIAHELAHITLEKYGYNPANPSKLESACDYLGGALIAPREAAVELHRAYSFNFAEIADECRANETWAALRMGEITSRPTWVVSPSKVRYRGRCVAPPPTEAAIRSWVAAPKPDITPVRLTDAAGRHALLLSA